MYYYLVYSLHSLRTATVFYDMGSNRVEKNEQKSVQAQLVTRIIDLETPKKWQHQNTE